MATNAQVLGADVQVQVMMSAVEAVRALGAEVGRGNADPEAVAVVVVAVLGTAVMAVVPTAIVPSNMPVTGAAANKNIRGIRFRGGDEGRKSFTGSSRLRAGPTRRGEDNPLNIPNLRRVLVRWIARFLVSFSPTASALGLLLFSASLTPSLLPRPPLMQGLLGGISLIVGYALGITLLGLWRFMQLRQFTPTNARRSGIGLLVVTGVVAAVTLAQMTVWQNSIRVRMQMPDVDSSYPLRVLVTAVVVAIVLLLVGRSIGHLVRVFANWLTHVMPPRVASVVSVLVLSIVGFNLVNGLIVRTALRGLDETFAAIDQAVDTELGEPSAATASGSSESLIDWSEIGKNGKRFVVAGPTAADIEQLTGRPAKPPLRVYAGYNTRDSLPERAEVAVQELIRVGGFERQVLVVATPTGTGWLDPSSVDPLEYLHDGDIATVSMQYSYLPSWLTIMVDPDRSRHAAEALFNRVYAHWTELPADARPRLYLFGLSLGSLGSEAALDFYDLISDPIDGAVLSGPPFPSTMWPDLVRNRRPGTPAWLPEFRQSDLVRFMNHEASSTPPGTPWGTMRIMYLQHGSDPMAWFSPSLAWHKPDWLNGEKAPDVSPHFRWFPLVTFLQVGFDVPMATSAPIGYAHNYSPAEYIDAWIEVTAPQAWSAADTEALKAAYADFNPSPLSN